MNQPQDDWESLQAQWQAYQPDIQKIKRRIHWVTWRMYFILLVDLIIVVTYVPFLWQKATSSESNWIIDSWFHVMGILILYGVYIDFKIRWPILRNQATTTKQILELHLARVKAGIELGWWGKVFCWVMLPLTWLWNIINSYIDGGDPKYTDLKFIIFITVWIGSMSLAFVWYERKKQRELEKLSQMWQDYLI